MSFTVEASLVTVQVTNAVSWLCWIESCVASN